MIMWCRNRPTPSAWSLPGFCRRTVYRISSFTNCVTPSHQIWHSSEYRRHTQKQSADGTQARSFIIFMSRHTKNNRKILPKKCTKYIPKVPRKVPRFFRNALLRCFLAIVRYFESLHLRHKNETALLSGFFVFSFVYPGFLISFYEIIFHLF